jgi:hypothetical protein
MPEHVHARTHRHMHTRTRMCVHVSVHMTSEGQPRHIPPALIRGNRRGLLTVLRRKGVPLPAAGHTQLTLRAVPLNWSDGEEHRHVCLGAAREESADVRRSVDACGTPLRRRVPR